MFNVHGERVALVTDTSCDLSDEQLARYDISMVSLRVVAAAGEFRDRVEINQEEMYELLKNEVPRPRCRCRRIFPRCTLVCGTRAARGFCILPCPRVSAVPITCAGCWRRTWTAFVWMWWTA